MRRPSFQFYPGDWQSNTKLRRCSHEEKGIWLDVMCLLHDSDEYGVIRWSVAEIARAVGTTKSKIRKILQKNILKGDENFLKTPFIYTPRSGRKNGNSVELIPAQKGPIFYCSRMVVDEYKRKNSGGSTRFKGNQGEAENTDETVTNDTTKKDTKPSASDPPDPSPCRRQGEGESDGSSSSSSSSSSNKTTTTTGDLNNSREIPKNFRPHEATIKDLRDCLIPDWFIETYLEDFCRFWGRTGSQKPNWDYVFYEQCQQRWSVNRPALESYHAGDDDDAPAT